MTTPRPSARAALAAAVAVAVLLVFPCAGSGETIEVGPGDDWFAVLHGGGLKPGDEVVLAAGVYSDRRRLEMNHRGTAAGGITIRAADGAEVVLRRPDARQNTINMHGCRHLTLRGFEITGGSAGIRIGKQGDQMSGFLTFEALHIHHIGGVAITANHEGNVYERLVFRGNHIHHTGGHGEAFYLGCNNAADGSTPGYVFDCLVEGNYIHDLKGGTVSQGDGVEIKDGSYGNTVRDNVIHDTKFPGVTVYGTDGKAPNIVEGNIIWNTGDNGIQAAADAVLRGNYIFDFGGDGIHCRTHQSAEPGNLAIEGNVIVSRGRGGKTGLRIISPKSGKYRAPDGGGGQFDLRPAGDPGRRAGPGELLGQPRFGVGGRRGIGGRGVAGWPAAAARFPRPRARAPAGGGAGDALIAAKLVSISSRRAARSGAASAPMRVGCGG